MERRVGDTKDWESPLRPRRIPASSFSLESEIPADVEILMKEMQTYQSGMHAILLRLGYDQGMQGLTSDEGMECLLDAILVLQDHLLKRHEAMKNENDQLVAVVRALKSRIVEIERSISSDMTPSGKGRAEIEPLATERQQSRGLTALATPRGTSTRGDRINTPRGDARASQALAELRGPARVASTSCQTEGGGADEHDKLKAVHEELRSKNEQVMRYSQSLVDEIKELKAAQEAWMREKSALLEAVRQQEGKVKTPGSSGGKLIARRVYDAVPEPPAVSLLGEQKLEDPRGEVAAGWETLLLSHRPQSTARTRRNWWNRKRFLWAGTGNPHVKENAQQIPGTGRGSDPFKVSENKPSSSPSSFFLDFRKSEEGSALKAAGQSSFAIGAQVEDGVRVYRW
ncbi:hypothetical protein GUITHDRAFT_105753 [Guillardia theta CCMP2712]|uniref:Uncharacterized protein n=1 Tax=Guillardia theta (strain CCMP2712) TaxID=905079 RepID=L1JJU9_GUITC|nr:hypothetical protein GUITHDRAFT_105753 [Guillardia theta CCMP2712]EKX48607.1 hypothetical protein GUITHDRAFT_105753 [Guillardia theta CCMP2712]|eukprot:XP_005835587.1 hypothetical protein GUITHDRAFT_105753 [Guillardia theta CCMP2712]